MRKVLLVALLCLPSLSLGAMIAPAWDGQVYLIDERTGAGARLGASGVEGLNAAASTLDGRVLSATDGALIELDPASGLAVPTGIVIPEESIRGLAVSPTNGLVYVLACTAPGNSCPDRLLYTADLDTGEVSVIGATGGRGLQGLAFSPTGVLYASSVDDAALYTVDTDTAQATPIGGLPRVSYQALEFDPVGRLFSARYVLHQFDPNLGAARVVGSGFYFDVRGLAHVGNFQVAATALGIESETASCANLSTPQEVQVPLSGRSRGKWWNCEVAGAVFADGDAAELAIVGIAIGPNLGGQVDRLVAPNSEVLCTNITSGESALVALDPSGRYLCTGGLAVRPGDQVSIVVSGIVGFTDAADARTERLE